MTKKELINKLNQMPGADNECVVWIDAVGLYFSGEMAIKEVMINKKGRIELMLDDLKNV
jgi:hypothetical protein